MAGHPYCTVRTRTVLGLQSHISAVTVERPKMNAGELTPHGDDMYLPDYYCASMYVG